MLSRAEIDALVQANHGDPFALLGPHRDEEGTLWLRSLQPGAREIVVVDPDDGELASLSSVHPIGLFEGSLDDAAIERGYRLRVTYTSGSTEVLEDPYRFESSVGELDRHLFAEGTHLRPWLLLGARVCEQQGVAGVRFCVWAPNAARVSVVGSFNHWDGRRHPMRGHPGSGIWELFIPGIGEGTLYKYELRTQSGDVLAAKADPYGFCGELRPATASVVVKLPPKPKPRARALDSRAQPMSIYEVHLGSWRRGEGDRMLDWDELAASLPAYAKDMGFTHLELLPISEFPFDGSWGYQVTGMYAPTRRFGDPAAFARFVAACHEADIGLLLDWVPAHFPTDAHALARFDGTALYEYEDEREGFHRDWNTLIYNFSRHEVRSFLVGSALYWLEQWGLDGLRVDAVASMLYRDYSREEGEWVPNVHGGRENLEAIALLRRMNEVVGAEAPGCITVAEESTSWPKVSRPTSEDGLGFHYKWNMGWMHDTLAYMAKEPVHRSHHHHQMTFGLVYAFSENFVLPLSHDEVVHGKGSLINKMPGDRWQRFANLRAYFGFMWTHPGKKLLFMGCEFAQEREWNHDHSLDWHLLDEQNPEGAEHRGMQALVRDLNHLYRERAALHAGDCVEGGFEWLVVDDSAHSVFAFVRRHEQDQLLVICNFTPVPRDYRMGVPEPGSWRERFNTDSEHYAGSNMGNGPELLHSAPEPAWGREHSILVKLPPLATLILERA